MLRAFSNVDCSAENFTSSTQHYKPLKIRAQVLIKKYVMMDVQMTHLSYNLNNFSTNMSSMIGDWSHVWLTLSVDCRRKYYKINAAKQAISRLERKFWLNKIYFWTYKTSISVRTLNIFVRIWAQWSVDWSHVWLSSSADCRREGQNFNSVLGDFLFKSASFNQAENIFVHVNDPSELKYR